MTNHTITLELTPLDNHRLALLLGNCDAHMIYIERQLDVQVNSRGHHIQITGEHVAVQSCAQLLQDLYQETQYGALSDHTVELAVRHVTDKLRNNADNNVIPEITPMKMRHGLVKPRGANQSRYINHMQHYDINFGIGPAGTGKTYLAVACAVQALKNDQVSRIVLVRPAVEAGEKLGFLPGDLTQKVDPYLRPLYDALYEMLGFAEVDELVERHVIEIAPLAYMRGRTLNDAFIILDESQNTTVEQMKMFLTRIGFNAKAVITGDPTQADLPSHKQSGLDHAITVLANINEIKLTFFKNRDVVRHPLVQRIIQAYEQADE